MNIEVPSILRDHEQTLGEFFNGMIFKLAVNAHKDQLVAKDVPLLIDLMLDELQELKDEIRPGEEIDSNALSETFDGANFWYLLFQFLRKSGVPDAREQFLSEYFHVHWATGKVFAKKNRSGSRYREGEEVVGTYRNGRCYIRTQHALTGAAVSLPRDHIVWWAFQGVWPSTDLEHRDGDPGNDAIDNLVEKKQATERQFPFVTQYKPAGKEETSAYGKWCYQRRHNLVLVKVGYYDTAEDAARQGLIDWKAKIKEGQTDV